ncbi:MAG: EutP/PduV family microcompartment system protein [Oscillospiraceae bacterium]|nr:EutP/PduV family microcompartment system protein [Oscillospiraceae bacterium]
MKKIILIGKVGCGKTTLRQALKGEGISYHKTQYVNHFDVVIDTPGEYAQSRHLARGLAIFSFEADVIGFMIKATDDYSLYPPNLAPMATREVIGIVTQINKPDANPERAKRWLELVGCKNIFLVDSKTGEGVDAILDYLEVEKLPQKKEKK